MFRDVTTLLNDNEGFERMISLLVERYKSMSVDMVAGIEARGFITGAVLADRLGVGFVPIRKKGKLPGETESVEYQLEYGTDVLEIHTDAIKPGMNVLIADDLIATGGTALAAAELVTKVGGNITEFSFIVDLPELGGMEKLKQNNYPAHALVDFEGH